jgi:glutamate/tyrosine decarboxylase-like PLP-dependent enzyme
MYFGTNGIGQMIDRRLEMTTQIQTEISKRADLVLLNDTDINSCVFLFLPNDCQGRTLSAPDVEKVSAINESIKAHLIVDAEFYLHGFRMKCCPHKCISIRGT